METVSKRINFGMSRKVRKPHRKSRIICKNSHIIVPDDWDFDRDYERIRDRLLAEVEPGWSLSGWCLADPGSPEGEYNGDCE